MTMYVVGALNVSLLYGHMSDKGLDRFSRCESPIKRDLKKWCELLSKEIREEHGPRRQEKINMPHPQEFS